MAREFTGSITDTSLLDRMLAEFEVDRVFHLAALLSTRAEFTPITRITSTSRARSTCSSSRSRQGESHGRAGRVRLSVVDRRVRPARTSTTKTRAGRVREDDYTHPTTMYGCNKLYCEQLGRYYARHYKQLSADTRRAASISAASGFPG